MKPSYIQRLEDERSTLLGRLDKLRELGSNKLLDEQTVSHSKGMCLHINPDGMVDIGGKDGTFPQGTKRKRLNERTYKGLESLIIANALLGEAIRAASLNLHVE